MQLGADGPARAGGGRFDRADDPAGRADLVGQIDDLHHALGMDQDADVRVFCAELGHMLRQKT